MIDIGLFIQDPLNELDFITIKIARVARVEDVKIKGVALRFVLLGLGIQIVFIDSYNGGIDNKVN